MSKLRTALLRSGLIGLTLTLWLGGAEVEQGDLDKSGTIGAADEVILRNYLAGNLVQITGQAGQLWQVDTIAGNLRFVPAGTFRQGFLEDDPCVDPAFFQHTLTKNLAVMETEVTRQMWADLLYVQPSLPADPSDTVISPDLTCPVQNLTWYAAVLFANLLSLQQGLEPCYYKDAAFTDAVDSTDYTSGSFYCDWDADGFRLLAEGEWEYCCRAGTETSFSLPVPGFTTCADYCGASDLPELQSVAWYCANAGGAAHPAGQKNANPRGLKDIHGNVQEWCWDRYASYPAGPATDYRGPGSGSRRVWRGGRWEFSALLCRSAARGDYGPGWIDDYTGFRLARTVSGPGLEALNGDLDHSGTIDASDAVILRNYLTGNIDEIPSRAGQLHLVDPLAGNLRHVPAGTFNQGRLTGDPCDDGNNTPFTHTLTRRLAVMETEVTRAMWAALQAADPTGFTPADPSHYAGGTRPVESVTWHEAILFANRLSVLRGLTPCYYVNEGFTTPVDKTNYNSPSMVFYCNWDANGFRLPSEGEWEYFCRAGTTAPFWIPVPGFITCASYCDAADLPELQAVAWFCANNISGGYPFGTKPAGKKTANRWGLKDVHGNVNEWCWDWYNATYPAGPETDYRCGTADPVESGKRVHRGCGYSNSPTGIRSAFRNRYQPGSRSDHVGFRLVRTLP